MTAKKNNRICKPLSFLIFLFTQSLLSLSHRFRQVELIWFLSFPPQASLVLQLVQEDSFKYIAQLISSIMTTRENQVLYMYNHHTTVFKNIPLHLLGQNVVFLHLIITDYTEERRSDGESCKHQLLTHNFNRTS